MVSAEHLMMVLRGLEGLSNVVVITVKENEGMFGHAQDEALVALCDWKISYDAFPHFEFFRTHKTMISWKLDVRTLLKMIAGAEKNSCVEIYSADNPAFLGISYVEQSGAGGGRRSNEEFNAKLPLLKITEEDRAKVEMVPKEYYDNRVQINAKSLLFMVSALQTVAANVKLSVAVADLFFAQNSPIIVRYFLGESSKNGYLSFFTSPLLQNDGKRDEDVAPGYF
eukprot:g4666.t1